jgi:hypothetical protein
MAQNGVRGGAAIARSDEWRVAMLAWTGEWRVAKGASGVVWRGARARQGPVLKEQARPGQAPPAKGRRDSKMFGRSFASFRNLGCGSISSLVNAANGPKGFMGAFFACDDGACRRHATSVLSLSPVDPNRLRHKPISNPTGHSIMLATSCGLRITTAPVVLKHPPIVVEMRCLCQHDKKEVFDAHTQAH